MMRPETTDLLKRLDDADWFAAVGRPLPEALQSSILAVASWDEAVACCSSDEWENFTLEQQNRLTMHLHEHARELYRRWNDLVRVVKEELHPLVERKVLPAVARLASAHEPTPIRDSVQWDVLGACLELEYADVREPAFFCGLMGWYLVGRFPCGWGERDVGGGLALHGPLDEGEYDPNEPDWLKLVLSYQEPLFRPKVSLPKAGKLLVY
jgi:hypothetical protein